MLQDGRKVLWDIGLSMRAPVQQKCLCGYVVAEGEWTLEHSCLATDR